MHTAPAADNAPETARKPEGTTASGYTASQERELSRLSALRREANAALDADTVNELDVQIKNIRAAAGKQTFGDRVSDTLGAIFSGSAASSTNLAGYAVNAVQDPDHNRRQVQRLKQSLETGRLSDGKPVTPAMRKTIQESIDRLTLEALEWEAEDSTANKISARRPAE